MTAKTGFVVAAAAAVTSLLIAPPVLGGTRGTHAGPENRMKVRVMDNFFDPRSVTVPQEGRVVWTWKGTNRHNVRFTHVPKGASRRGSRTRADGRWSRSFGKPGLYRYVCTIYAGMRGNVTVKPVTTESGAPARG
jgi:plastocyanin